MEGARDLTIRRSEGSTDAITRARTAEECHGDAVGGSPGNG